MTKEEYEIGINLFNYLEVYYITTSNKLNLLKAELSNLQKGRNNLHVYITEYLKENQIVQLESIWYYRPSQDMREVIINYLRAAIKYGELIS